jgi:hypothetical protein
MNGASRTADTGDGDTGDGDTGDGDTGDGYSAVGDGAAYAGSGAVVTSTWSWPALAAFLVPAIAFAIVALVG